jgi:prevent-host-death family protein
MYFMAVNVHEAKTHLSKLLQRVAAGEEIIIAKAGVPVAKLVSVQSKTEERKLGIDEGRIYIADDFDAPLPDDILAGFYGEDVGPKKKSPRPATRRHRKAR